MFQSSCCLILISFCVGLYFVPTIECTANTTLVQVFYFGRHGDRTPTDDQTYVYPKDDDHDGYSPVGYGNLTDGGIQRAFNVGVELRSRYGDFLSETYSEDEIYVRATEVYRTILTAKSILAGLYESNEPNVTLDTAIPVHTEPKKTDDLEYSLNCRKWQLKVAKIVVEYTASKLSSYSSLYKNLSSNTGHIFISPYDVFNLNDVLLGDESFGFGCPDWATALRDQINTITDEFFMKIAPTDDTTLSALSTGVLLNDIVNIIANTTAGNRDRKFYLYLTHDVNLVALLSATNISWSARPGFASNLVFELREDIDTGDYGIVARYVQKGPSSPEYVHMQGCTSGTDYFCPLDTFNELVEDLLLTKAEYTKKCKLLSFG